MGFGSRVPVAGAGWWTISRRGGRLASFRVWSVSEAVPGCRLTREGTDDAARKPRLTTRGGWPAQVPESQAEADVWRDGHRESPRGTGVALRGSGHRFIERSIRRARRSVSPPTAPSGCTVWAASPCSWPRCRVVCSGLSPSPMSRRSAAPATNSAMRRDSPPFFVTARSPSNYWKCDSRTRTLPSSRLASSSPATRLCLPVFVSPHRGPWRLIWSMYSNGSMVDGSSSSARIPQSLHSHPAKPADIARRSGVRDGGGGASKFNPAWPGREPTLLSGSSYSLATC